MWIRSIFTTLYLESLKPILQYSKSDLCAGNTEIEMCFLCQKLDQTMS